MNKAEKIVQNKYKKKEYFCLHNRGFPDFIFYKIKDNKIEKDSIEFVEVKTPTDRLRHEQLIFKKIATLLGLKYRVEVVVNNKPTQTSTFHPIPSQTTPNQSNPVHSKPKNIIYPIQQSTPFHTIPTQTIPFQAIPTHPNPNQTKNRGEK